MVNATRRAKARLDSPGIALQGRVQADTFGAQQREVRAAVSRLPQPEWRQARSEADDVPPVTELTPRTARVEPTYIVLPLTTIEEMARPSKAGPVYAGASPHQVDISGTLVFAARCVHVVPLSVDL